MFFKPKSTSRIYGRKGAIPLKKSDLKVTWVADRRSRPGGERRVASGDGDRCRGRNQHGELAEVFGGSGEVEFIAGTVRPA